ALITAHLRDGELRAEIRIFSGAFDDPSPPRIACDIDHRRESPMQSRGRGFDGGDTRGRLDALGPPRARHRHRDGENRSIAVYDVHCEQQRYAEARLLDRDLLQLRKRLGTGDVQIGTHLPGSYALQLRVIEARIQRLAPTARALHELSELLLERHLLEQSLGTPCGLRIRVSDE